MPIIGTDVFYWFQKFLGLTAALCFFIWAANAGARRAFLNLVERLDNARKARVILLALAAFSVWTFLLPILRHKAFQSHTLELGILTNVSWNFLQGKGFYDPVMHVQNYLGDHWQPVLALMAPVFWFWRNAAALIVIQSLGLVAGGIMVYRLSQKILSQRSWAILVAAMYFLSAPMHAINRFDFHPEFLAVPLIVAGYSMAYRKLWWKAFFCFAALWLVKEDMAIVAAAIGSQFVLCAKESRRFGILMITGSAFVLGVVIFVLMPLFLDHATPTHLARYANLGTSWPEIFKKILLKPHFVLFEMVGHRAFWQGLKNMILPFLGLPLLSPASFWSAIVLAWLPHALSSYAPQRELAGQYAAAFLPILTIGSAHAIKKLLEANGGVFRVVGAWLRQTTAWPLLAVVISQWSFTVSRYFSPIDPARLDVLNELVRLVPKEGTVCAQSDLGPHLAFRQELTQFPDISQAQFIALDINGNKWPLSDEEYGQRVQNLETDHFYELLYNKEGARLYRKIAGTGADGKTSNKE
ncbi:MAG: DUF2079 domain-containing protein [Elusimicrobia bacterium]|nr:DUF2079 domain-containing protein [Elusimicrobiota bacterium]